MDDNGSGSYLLLGLVDRETHLSPEVSTELEQWAREWEGTHGNWQLTHIRNHPRVESMVKLGKEAIPFVLEKLEKNRLWYIPMEEIIRREFDEDLEVTDNEGEPEGISGGRYTHLEGYREACQRWAEENKERYL